MKRVILLSLLLTFIIVPIAYAAQDIPSEDLVNAVTLAVSALGALVANFVITAIKNLSYLKDEEKTKLQQAVTEAVAVGVSILTGYLLSLLAQGVGLISDSTLQTTVISILTPIFAELRYRLAKLSPQV